MRKFTSMLLVSFLLLATLPACSATQEQASLNMAPMSGMPAEVQSAPVSVQQAYQFAAANPDLMKQVPCYCGCGAVHQNNYQCYIKAVNADGSFVFDDMSLG